MSTSTPALRTSHAQGTPTSAHLSRQQRIPTSALRKPSSVKERLLFVEESALEETLALRATTVQPDQENVAPPANASNKKTTAPPRRSITFSADTYTNESPRTSARRALSLRGDGVSNPILRFAVESTSTFTKQAVRSQQATASQHSDDSDEEMLASAWGDVAGSDEMAAGTCMGGPRQRLEPTPELSQEINVRSSVARETEVPAFRPWSREPEPITTQTDEFLSSHPAAEPSSRPTKGRKSTTQSSTTPARSSSKRRVTAASSSTTNSPSKSPNPRVRKNRRTTLGISASLLEPLTAGPTTPVRSQRTKARPIPATDRPVRQRKSTVKPASRRSTGSNESTSDRIDRRSRRRSIAPDYLSKRAGTIDVPEPTSPGDDPLLLKGSLPRRRSVSRRRNGADESQEYNMVVVDHNGSPAVRLAPEGTPIRRTDMEDVSMTSPGGDSPSPSERTLAARKASRSTSVHLAHTNSMLSPSPSRSNLAPGSVNRLKSLAKPILLGRALAHAKAAAIAEEPEAEPRSNESLIRAQDKPAAYVDDPMVQVEPEHSSYVQYAVNDAEEEKIQQEERDGEYNAEEEEEQAEEQFEEELPSKSQNGMLSPPPVHQQPVDFNDAGEQHSHQWMGADEWLMNERDSISPAPKTATVQFQSSPVLEEEDEEYEEEEDEEPLEDAVMLSPPKHTRQQAVEDHEKKEHSAVAYGDEEEEHEEEWEEEWEEEQSPDYDALETPQEESATVKEPPRSTVVVRLSVTTVKVEPEEYGMWAMAQYADSPATSAPSAHDSSVYPAVGSPSSSQRNARSGNHSQDSDVPLRSADVSAISANPRDSASRSPAAPLSPSEEIDQATASGSQSQQPFVRSKIYSTLEEQTFLGRNAEHATEKAEDDQRCPAEEAPLRNQQQPSGAMQVVLQQLKERKRVSTSPSQGTQARDTAVQSRRQAIRVRAYESSGDEDDDPRADESVVEVYSRDPAAAARAAAILKLNYNYIEHGYAIPAATTPRKSAKSNRISLTATGPRIARQSATGKKRMSLAELLHEAELDLAIGPAPPTPSGGDLQRTSSVASMLEMPGALPPSPPRNNGTSPMRSGITKPPTPPKAHDKPWKRNDWRELEKAYRRTERRFSKLPQRSTGEPTAPMASSDPDIIIDTFMHMKGLAEEDLRGEWGRSVLLMRIRALERRMGKHPGLSQEASSSQLGEGDDTPHRPRKRARTEEDGNDALETPSSTGLTASTTASRLTSFFKGLQGHLPRPSLSLLSSPSVSKSIPSVSAKSSGRELESAIGPQPQMRQIQSITPRSVPTTRPSVIAPTFTTPSAASQHSQAIKALFPNTVPTAATKPIPIPPKAAAKAPIRLSQGSSYSNTPTVKDLIRSFDSFEDVSGLASGDVSGSSLRRVTSSSSLRAGKNGGERRLTEH